MTTMFIKHAVNDYNQWKGVYDSFAPTRKAYGVTGASVHQDANNPNILMITQQFNNMDAAMTFAGSDDLKAAMANAGVVGKPDITFCEDIEQTAY